MIQRLFKELGQRGNGGISEKIYYGYFSVVESSSEPGMDRGDQERMTAKIEEVIVNPEIGDLQHFPPNFGDITFCFRAGRSTVFHIGRPYAFHLGQTFPVHLSA